MDQQLANLEDELRNSKAIEEEALAKCNNEPISIPGGIQSYGALLAFDFDTLRITYASDNVQSLLTLPGDLFSLTVREVFTSEDYHIISNIASHRSTFKQREHVKVVKGSAGRLLEVSLYRTTQHVVLEFIPQKGAATNSNINSHVKWVLDQIREAKTVEQVLQITVQSLQSITGFDRVMAYKFHLDDSGEVVAEANNQAMETYLGLRFPAEDIPTQARAIYSRVSIRSIYSTMTEDTNVLAANETLPPLDMTLGILRANSPVHAQYLRNMGVGASISLPIMIGGKLWGLFAHHHHEEVALSSDLSYSAELIGQMVSMVLEQKIEQLADLKVKNLQLQGDDFVTLNQDKRHLNTFWENYATKLKSFISCDGVAYQLNEQVLVHGSCPSPSTIKEIGRIVVEKALGPTYQTDELMRLELEEPQSSRGVLVLQIHELSPPVFIYFFRDEVLKKVVWAGNPQKDIVVEKTGVRLHPRSSFRQFNELNEGRSEPWDSETLILADVALKKLKQVALNEKFTNERLKIVIQELNHRIRNILGLVRSISRRSAESGNSIEDYVDSLEQRILALSKANNLLTSDTQTPVLLKNLLLQIIPPLCGDQNNLELQGADVKLSPQITPTVVLIIHELTTNAVKYGAFSTKEGSVVVSWDISEKSLNIKWKERGGPPVHPPEKVGFGSGIIENAISYEFGGASKMDFQEDGLLVRLTIPHDYVGEHGANQQFALEQVLEAKYAQPAKGLVNVLILEDDFINAQDMKDIITKQPVNEVALFSNPEQALAAVRSKTFHLALLDVNLRNETSLDVALECAKADIPFYYLTGYGDAFLKDGVFPKAPVLLKPLSTERLKELVGRYLRTDD
ncbi:MAG: HWE histidine kinase domain-containing protein [Bacteroidota bacterium]